MKPRETQIEDLIQRWRGLLVEADSMLSAAGHGRVVGKDEMLALSGRLRVAYESVKVSALLREEAPQPEGHRLAQVERSRRG